MSYILDALRRADSERERGAIPGLHTQAVPVGATDVEAEPRSGPWKWLVVVAFVVLLGLVAWLWLGRDAAPEPLATAKPAPPPLATAAPSMPAVPAPVTAPTAPSATAAADRPLPTGAVATREPALDARKPPPSPPLTVTRKPTPAAASASATPASKQATKAAPPAKASEPEVRISTLAELPDEVRRELPAITVGGSIYSKSAANRMLVINGQVFHEGDELAPGLVLEQIRQKAAVLKIKGYRYEIGY